MHIASTWLRIIDYFWLLIAHSLQLHLNNRKPMEPEYALAHVISFLKASQTIHQNFAQQDDSLIAKNGQPSPRFLNDRRTAGWRWANILPDTWRFLIIIELNTTERQQFWCKLRRRSAMWVEVLGEPVDSWIPQLRFKTTYRMGHYCASIIVVSLIPRLSTIASNYYTAHAGLST